MTLPDGDAVQVARELGQRLKAGDAAVAELLSEDVTFHSLNIEISGREAVLRRLTDRTTGQVYREASWQDFRRNGDAVQVTARMPAGAGQSGNILLLQVRGGRIAGIRQQLVRPTPPAPETPLRLTAELVALIDGALATGHPMLLSFVDETGQPNLSFRGSTQAFGEDRLAIWVRNPEGQFVRSIALNPKVALIYRDQERKITFQFQGRARVSADAGDRQLVYRRAHQAEQDHDYARLGALVIVDLDRIEGYAGLTAEGPVGRINMRRQPGQ